MRWAGKVAPTRFTFVWNVYSFTRPRLSHFFRLSVVIVYWTEPQPVTTNKYPFSLNASSQGAQAENEKQKQTWVASFQPVLVSSFCAVLSIFVLS